MNTLSSPWRTRAGRLAWAIAGLLATPLAATAAPAALSSVGPGTTAAGFSAPLIPASAPDNVPAATPFSYLNIVGTAFVPRNDGVGFTFAGGGCTYTTAGNRRLTFKTLLPDGALVKYVRIFYKDTSATEMNVWLTSYDGAGTNVDLTMVASSGDSGYGTTLSAELNYTVDQYTDALALVATPTVSDDTQQLCGVRIAYYDPIDLDTIFENGFD